MTKPSDLAGEQHKAPEKALALAFHDVVDGAGEPGSRRLYTIDRQRFRHLLGQMKTTASPTAPLPLYLTFDDGADGSYHCAAEELELSGKRGYFFVVSDWIGRPGFLSAAQIRDLHARGHVIGSHSRSHPERMSHLPWPELLREWGTSCRVLADILGEPVRTASVPNGYYGRHVAESAAAAGVHLLFTSEPRVKRTVVDGCLTLGRYCVQRQTPPSHVAGLVNGALLPRWKQTALWEAKKVLKTAMGESYITLRRQFLNKRFQ